MSESIDPTRATSAAFNRRVFVGLSAATAAGGATIAAALAAGTDLGKPHPPLVAEDDPAISTGTPAISYGTRTLASYVAAPKNAGPATPAIVVVQAIWGVDAQLRDTVRRLAKEGYVAVAPDLYTGLQAPSGDNSTDFAPFREVASKLADAVVDADLAAAAAFIRSGAGNAKRKVGVTGFCMGGAIALRQAVDNATVFDAAAVFYGKVRYGTTENDGAITPIALAYADDIGVPLAGSWGGRDTSILADDVRALDARLASSKKPHDFKIYDDAGHAFFDDTRNSYVPSAASDAWSRTLAWFKQHLA
jgi:carboxymethylenebutenolidase